MNFLMFVLLSFLSCDNEEYRLDNVSHVTVFNKTFDVSSYNHANSIKMSFGPEHLLRFRAVRLENGKEHLYVYNLAKYYTERVPITIRLDWEYKYGPCPLYVYKFIAFTAVVVVLNAIFVNPRIVEYVFRDRC